MLWIVAVFVAFLLVVPGIEFLRWLVVDLWKLYDQLSLTDGCLIILVVLQAATLVHLIAWRQADREAAASRVSEATTRRPATALTGRSSSSRRSSRTRRNSAPPVPRDEQPRRRYR